MPSKKNLLKNVKLYLILDREVCDYPRLFEILQQALAAGVDIVQLRDKKGSAQEILKFSKSARELIKGKIPYIINDRVDLSLVSGATGVHVGQDDIPVRTARKILGTKAVLGASCQTFAQAKKAQSEGADYIGFGSVFKTLTKPQRHPMDLELLRKVMTEIKIPVFAIGGITVENLEQLCSLGVQRVAVCRDICLAKDIGRAVQQLRRVLDNAG